MDEKVRGACVESFAETCYKLGVKMEACEFGPGNVHLFFSGCRKYSVPYMAQMFKCASSRKIRAEYNTELERALSDPTFARKMAKAEDGEQHKGSNGVSQHNERC